ncbi:blr6973 [Bradyrhizobium diazoefficiens USDA 110]|uniref:Blr6973 protein n=1 Tax=Bradyrhizobium diazoefficiens (strain JCM 10833 / BCRC 13528 / IAM 13628 / NBRC 14792 / USDA 110) TaxID=224911 RepID=Q89EU7_BRADU|nr:hypothetical protein CO678_13170 [Bradyrhizobium diazoefficiens]QBP25712.1 hypothetical protein Bdiaspc4_36765 [Bradyrhizobium diazoefficiens]BAC52238.1 blr6973 [Bradyrhizobium diazoefficiens USDA 110]
MIYLLRKSIKRPLSARRCPAHAWMDGLDRTPDPCRDDRKRPIVKAIMADLVRSRTILQLASSSEGLHHQTLPIADLGPSGKFRSTHQLRTRTGVNETQRKHLDPNKTAGDQRI